MTQFPIKFRAWHKYEKRWLDRIACVAAAGEPLSIIGATVFGDMHIQPRESTGNLNNEVEIFPFTGLKDSAGIDIYTCDILKGFNESDSRWVIELSPDTIGYCSFTQAVGGDACYPASSLLAAQFTVIGNQMDDSLNGKGV